MSNKTYLLLLTVFIVTTSFCQKKTEPGYIKLGYNGDQTKPYPRILLYTKGSTEYLNDTISSHKVEVSEKSFLVIKNSIQKIDFINQDSALQSSNNYEFLISKNGETVIFFTTYLTRIRELVNVIVHELKDSDYEKAVKYQLNSIILRITYDNKLN